MEQKKKTYERRSVIFKELRVIELDENNREPAIEGYASVFDSWSEQLGGFESFKEKVIKGAFLKTIVEDDIRALFNHDPNYVLGRNIAGTLTLQEDEKGLFVRITPPKTQWAKDLLVSISRGDISQMSFGFTVVLDRWIYENQTDIRELLEVKLFDVSPVTFPAYPETECDVRSTEEIFKNHQEEILLNKSKLTDYEKQKEIIKKRKLKLIKEIFNEKY